MQRSRIQGVEKIVVVGSGKGGVGKSTVSINLAVALAKRGERVGLLDADAYGPSIPLMVGVRKRVAAPAPILPLAEARELPAEKKLQPLTRYGVKIMSVGFFIGEEQAMAPLPDVLGMLIRQLLYLVNWGALDYLLIDLPPGTSEPQATLCREMQLAGAVLVTTPQDIARIDTSKALTMFRQAAVPVLGVVRNMDGLICPHCAERIDVFPQSTEARIQLDELPLLGLVPLDPIAVKNSDNGHPIVVSMPETAASAAFIGIAEQFVAALLEKKASSEEEGLRERERYEGEGSL